METKIEPNGYPRAEIKIRIFRRKVSMKLKTGKYKFPNSDTDFFNGKKNNRASVVCQIISRSLTYWNGSPSKGEER